MQEETGEAGLQEANSSQNQRQAVPITALLTQIPSQSLLRKNLCLSLYFQSRRLNCHSCGISEEEHYCRRGDSLIIFSAIPSVFSYIHLSHAPLSDCPPILRRAFVQT